MQLAVMPTMRDVMMMDNKLLVQETDADTTE